MYLSELLERLTAEGLPATQARIIYAITAGHATRPETDAAGNLDYGEQQLVELREYLSKPRRRGRKPRRERAASRS